MSVNIIQIVMLHQNHAPMVVPILTPAVNVYPVSLIAIAIPAPPAISHLPADQVIQHRVQHIKHVLVGQLLGLVISVPKIQVVVPAEDLAGLSTLTHFHLVHHPSGLITPLIADWHVIRTPADGDLTSNIIVKIPIIIFGKPVGIPLGHAILQQNRNVKLIIIIWLVDILQTHNKYKKGSRKGAFFICFFYSSNKIPPGKRNLFHVLIISFVLFL